MKCNFQIYKSPIGNLHLVADETNLHAIIFEKNWSKLKKNFGTLEQLETPLLKKTKKQISEYFAGKRKVFDLPYKLEGTPFQKQVWESLTKIPFGETRSYKEQAVLIKSPNAARAIGRADGLNPICIVLPCHRVIGSNGALTGYAGGVEAKKFLLKLEADQLRKDKLI